MLVFLSVASLPVAFVPVAFVPLVVIQHSLYSKEHCPQNQKRKDVKEIGSQGRV
jgi:hypothetical protein